MRIDVFSKRKRSEVMGRIRGSGNRGTELRLIEIFKTHRITGWRRNVDLPGRPDFVFPARRLAVFVDGCFWHGCPKHYQEPAGNRAFWREKISANRKRDRIVARMLSKKGWSVVRFWEHDLKRQHESRVIRRLSLQAQA
jgi:DNA mismatch endonuclease (patch repair protein)